MDIARVVEFVGDDRPLDAGLLVGSRGDSERTRAELPRATDLQGVDVVVHCAVDRSPDTPAQYRYAANTAAARAIVAACAAAGVRRLIASTSAAVYGAFPDNPVPLAEDAPLRAARAGIIGDLMAVDETLRAARAEHPRLDVCILRPAALTGGGVDSVLTRHFAAPRLLEIRDSGMRWQFCHVDDLAAAVELAVLGRVSGELTCGCAGWLTASDVADITGLRRVELPPAVVFATAERLHRAGLVPAAASELTYIAYPWVVPSTRLRSAGWRPVYDNTTALQALIGDLVGEHASVHAVFGRRLDRRDATLAGAGAAGATLAVLGAATFVRRARRLRGH